MKYHFFRFLLFHSSFSSKTPQTNARFWPVKCPSCGHICHNNVSVLVCVRVCVYFNTIITFRQPKCDEEMTWTANKQTQINSDIVTHAGNRYAGKQSRHCSSGCCPLRLDCMLNAYFWIMYWNSWNPNAQPHVVRCIQMHWSEWFKPRAERGWKRHKEKGETFLDGVCTRINEKYIYRGVHCLHGRKSKQNKSNPEFSYNIDILQFMRLNLVSGFVLTVNKGGCDGDDDVHFTIQNTGNNNARIQSTENAEEQNKRLKI